MKCPFCDHEMSEGVLTSGRYILWKDEDRENGKKKEYLLAKSYMGNAKMEGHLCPYCRKLVLDIPEEQN